MVALHTDSPEFMQWTWEDIEPRYRELEERDVTAETVADYLNDWSTLAARVEELGTRLEVATTINTADESASTRFRAFVQDVQPRIKEAEHRLKQKLLGIGHVPEGMEIPVRIMRRQVEMFREENLPLLSQEQLLFEEYFKITGAQTVEWEGNEIPIVQLTPVYEDQDRDRRERAWRLAATRRLQDAAAIDEIWSKLLDVRLRIAENAGFPDYRSYRWNALSRFDYTPDDAKRFGAAVEAVVVPACRRLTERRREKLGIDSIRPWDRYVDPSGKPGVHPYDGMPEFLDTLSTVFHRVDPTIGGYFDTMRHEDLLDLESRKNKAPGGYCTVFAAIDRPFIFGNCVGTQGDVDLLLHEGGHAFHVFESSSLPYLQQRSIGAIPMEFAEVASMAMELLARPYLTREDGGFYSDEDASRVRRAHLEFSLVQWTWIAIIDGFQHWIYEHTEEAKVPARLDEVWRDLVGRYMPFTDWSGLERELGNDWRRVLHIFGLPFYYIEYGLAQIGAVQVWANARKDQADAVRRYREALALGGTRSLPDLFAAAGARFAFDEAMFEELVGLMEGTIRELDA
jgi:oligoendopeptidase F